jgi:hypothetical protein
MNFLIYMTNASVEAPMRRYFLNGETLHETCFVYHGNDMNHDRLRLTSPFGGQQRMNVRKYDIPTARVTEERAVELMKTTFEYSIPVL